jgi:hypothetical protein
MTDELKEFRRKLSWPKQGPVINLEGKRNVMENQHDVIVSAKDYGSS